MVLCVMVLCSQRLCAQEMLLGVEEMFRLADRNSVSIKAYGTGREAADEALKAAKSQRLPDINASLSASFLGDGRLWNRDFSGGTGIDIPSFGNNFALEASQVIYAGGAVDSRIELAQIEKQMAELDWQKNRQDMHFLLLGWYLDLYKTVNQIKVLDRNLELADHVIENMQVRMEEGTVLKNDLTRYELQKETLELQRTVLQDGCRILNHQIVTVLHLPDSVKVVPDSSMLSCGILALGEQDWQQKAAQNSIDLRRSELGVRVNEQNLRLERSARLPQIAVMAAEHLDGPITIEVPVLDRNFNYWYVGIGLKYDLSSLFKSGRKIRQARLNVRRAQESRQLSMEQTETAVQAGYVNFMTSFSDLRTREKTVELADENYAVISNRYDNGLALLTDLLDAGNMKLSADLALENARTELDRYEKLLSRNAVTRQQYDNVHTAFQTAKARYERASRTKESASLLKSGQSYRLEQCEAAVRLAQAAVDLAGLNLSYTAVVATCDGITGHKDIHEGQLVQPGQTMVEIVDGTNLWVIANYRETQLRNISEGAKVSIKADAVPGIEYEGTVESISDATGAAFSLIPQDNATGNFVKVEQRVPVRIVLDGNPPEALKLLRAGFNVECKVRY